MELKDKKFYYWETILEEKFSTLGLHFSEVKTLILNGYLYAFPGDQLPKGIIDHHSKNYMKMDLSKFSYEMKQIKIPCFYPVTDDDKTIYLLTYDDSEFSDFRYKVVEFAPDEDSWSIMDVQGVAPKQREGNFACAYFNEALYFFGGFQKYLGDQTGSSVYRLDLLLKEWQTVIHQGDFPASKPFAAYFGNRAGMSIVIPGNASFLCFGGSIVKESSLPNLDVLGENIYDTIETSHLYEFNLKDYAWYFEYVKERRNINYNMKCELTTFSNHTACMYYPHMFIMSKQGIYCYNLDKNELYEIDYCFFFPRLVQASSIQIHNGFFYALGKLLDDDRFGIYRIPLHFLKRRGSERAHKLHDYFNHKASSDVVFKIDNQDLYCHKAVLAKDSEYLRDLFLSYNSKEVFGIKDFNYLTFHVLIDQIYKNFEEDLNFEFQILFDLLKAAEFFNVQKLQNKLERTIPLNTTNAVFLLENLNSQTHKQLFDRAVKYFMSKFENAASSNLKINMPSNTLVKLLKNIHCKHSNLYSIKKFFVFFELVSEVSRDFEIKNLKQDEMKTFPADDIPGLLENTQLNMSLCIDCGKLVGFNKEKFLEAIEELKSE